jgi:hypothetical protein
MIMNGIPEGLVVHGIDGGKTMPSWNTLHALDDDWWTFLFSYFDLVLSDSGSPLIMCNAKLPRLQKHIVALA